MKKCPIFYLAHDGKLFDRTLFWDTLPSSSFVLARTRSSATEVPQGGLG
jgi:hypothetical protein